MTREQLLARTFLELADTLGDDFDVLDFLQRLVDRTAEITGVTAAGLILLDHRDRLQLVASTTHGARELELFTLAIDEGPCLEVAAHGVSMVNLGAEESLERWPRFTQAAQLHGFRTTHVVPMRLRERVLGALSGFDVEESRLDIDTVAVMEAMAGVATIGLIQERTPRQRELMAQQLQRALRLRVEVEQAKGMVAELVDTDVGRAFDLLAGYSRRTGTPLGAVTSAVLERRLGPRELLADG